ncbi:hypothetical protein Tsp_09424 [Trichinella spiralis]|uniref:hypothetical protein n=1 Tax=Trichinella spiralis TaxID=6334 RepID=UPI0001EFD34C|nr:hypothetical protein Tsp_09424 [Trichinella spiralis]
MLAVELSLKTSRCHSDVYCQMRAYRRTAANKPPISQTSKPVPVVVRQLVLTSLVDLIQEGRHETGRGSSQLFTELCTTTRTSSHVDIHTVRRILTWSHSGESKDFTR